MRAKNMKKSRFVDNDNGTVTDSLTKLTWLKNANAFGRINLEQAMSDANDLSSGLAGLTDGSESGDWRLPSIKELWSLIDFAHINPALSSAFGAMQWTEGDAFIGVQSDYYWSGTISSHNSGYAWLVDLYSGSVSRDYRISTGYVWPVREGKGK